MSDIPSRLPFLGSAIQHGLLPSSASGYRIPRCVTLERAARSGTTASTYRTLEAPVDLSGKWNEQAREVASHSGRSDAHANFSGESYHAVLEDCYVATCLDQWNNPHRALFDSRGRSILADGFGYRRGHGLVFRQQSKNAAKLATCCWPLGFWPQNHCHWLVEDLPSIVLAQELGFAGHVVIPGTDARTPFNSHCLSTIGLDRNTTTDDVSPIVHIRTLHLVRSGTYHPKSVTRVRSALGASRDPGNRRLYLCRERANYRKVAEEASFWAMLESRGFERVFMEELGPDAQVDLMGEASVVVGLHGAGMANVAFCPPGAHVLEIIDRMWLSKNQQNYRKLSAANRLRYRAFEAGPVDAGLAPGYRDMSVDVASFAVCLDEFLRQD